jgi:hypothetical protein
MILFDSWLSFVIITHAYALKGIEDGNDFLGQLIEHATLFRSLELEFSF